MSRRDLSCSVVISEIIAIFFLVMLFTIGTEGSRGNHYIDYVASGIRWLVLLVFPLLGVCFIYVSSFIGNKFFPTFFQFSKFCLVGLSNTAIDFGVLNLLMYMSRFQEGFFFSFFKTISFIVAVLNSYIWNKFWTFDNREYSILLEQFYKFFVVVVVALIINVSIASLVVEMLSQYLSLGSKVVANIGALAGLVSTTFWNFFGMKFFVFSNPD